MSTYTIVAKTVTILAIAVSVGFLGIAVWNGNWYLAWVSVMSVLALLAFYPLSEEQQLERDMAKEAAEAEAQVGINFGALAPDISQQLLEQELDAPEEMVRVWQAQADNITRLGIAGLLTTKEVKVARQRLFVRISRNVHPIKQ